LKWKIEFFRAGNKRVRGVFRVEQKIASGETPEGKVLQGKDVNFCGCAGIGPLTGANNLLDAPARLRVSNWMARSWQWLRCHGQQPMNI